MLPEWEQKIDLSGLAVRAKQSTQAVIPGRIFYRAEGQRGL